MNLLRSRIWYKKHFTSCCKGSERRLPVKPLKSGAYLARRKKALQGKTKPEIKEIFIGIDLGTTNSVVAVIDETSNPIVVSDYETGSALLPSVVGYKKGGEVVVGADAQSLQIKDSLNTFSSVKRYTRI